MAQAAVPGGAVAVEDIDFAGHFCFPACPRFDRYQALYEEAVRHKGGDARIGPRLLGMFLDAGLQDVRLRVVLPTFRSGPGKHLAAVTLEHIRESVVGAGLATNVEFDTLVRALNDFAADPRTMMSLPRSFRSGAEAGTNGPDGLEGTRTDNGRRNNTHEGRGSGNA